MYKIFYVDGGGDIVGSKAPMVIYVFDPIGGPVKYESDPSESLMFIPTGNYKQAYEEMVD